MKDININFGSFETDSPFEAFAFTSAVYNYNHDQDTAKQIARLCYDLYLESSDDTNGIDLIDFICSDYDNLPKDFTEVQKLVEENKEGWFL